ncbi:MAG: ABC transporter ATP-binding protein [Prevotellaceae bacterium]|nr:ABC transporter ATP-binding protein [Prevotellaceae bacterium]
MISIKHISKTYTKGASKAVDDLSLDLEDGFIYGILGPNGAGKTTCLKMITGILKPDEGDVWLNGYSITKNALEAKREFAFVPDEPNAFLRLTGLEYLSFVCDVYEVAEEVRLQRVQDLSETFEMEDALGQRLDAYSHGMRQKIFLIGALVHNPAIWILDEPMTGLDPKASFTLKQMMRRHADEGNLVLFSTHVLDVAEKICDRIVIIDRGKMIFSGTIADMHKLFAGDRSLETMFLELTEENHPNATPDALASSTENRR